MIVTCVHVNVKPENVQDFIKAMIENRKGSVQEPGNLRFDVLQQADDPCRFMIYEAFESAGSCRSSQNNASLYQMARYRERLYG